MSTSTFGIVARIASYAIFGTGLAACAVYLRINRAVLSPGEHPAVHDPDTPADGGAASP